MTQISTVKPSYAEIIPPEMHRNEILPRLDLRDFFSISSTCKALNHRSWDSRTLSLGLQEVWNRHFPLTNLPRLQNREFYLECWTPSKCKENLRVNFNAATGQYTDHMLCIFNDFHCITSIFFNQKRECLCGYDDGSIMLYAPPENDLTFVPRKKTPSLTLESHRLEAPVQAVAQHKDLIVAGLKNGMICIWYDGLVNDTPKTFVKHNDNAICCLTISEDGQTIFFGHKNGQVGIIDKDLSIHSYDEFLSQNICALALYQQNIVCGNSDGSIAFNDINTKEISFVLNADGASPIQSLKVDQDHHKLFATYKDGSLQVWNLLNYPYPLAQFSGVSDGKSGNVISCLDLDNSRMLCAKNEPDIHCINFSSSNRDILINIANWMRMNAKSQIVRYNRLPADTKGLIDTKLWCLLMHNPLFNGDQTDLVRLRHSIELIYAISWYFTRPKIYNSSNPNTPILENIAYWLGQQAATASIVRDVLSSFNELPSEIRAKILDKIPDPQLRTKMLVDNYDLTENEMAILARAIEEFLNNS